MLLWILLIFIMALVITSIVFLLSMMEKDILINATRKRVALILFMIVCVSFLLAYYYRVNLYSYFYCYFFLFVYLIITSYVDICTFYVYSLVDYLFGLIGIVLIILNNTFYNTLFLIGGVLLFFVISFIMEKLRLYSGGDTNCFVVISIYMSIMHGNIIFVMMCIFYFSSIFILLFNIKSFNMKKQKFNKKIAYTPYICMSTIFTVFVEILIVL